MRQPAAEHSAWLPTRLGASACSTRFGTDTIAGTSKRRDQTARPDGATRRRDQTARPDGATRRRDRDRRLDSLPEPGAELHVVLGDQATGPPRSNGAPRDARGAEGRWRPGGSPSATTPSPRAGG